MYKWMYNRMVEDYSKKSKEELVQHIMALKEIECNDRSFANQCKAGTIVYDINELFFALDDLKTSFSFEKVTEVCSLIEGAKDSWNYIINSLADMNDSSRCSKQLDDFKKRVSNAKSNNDNI